MERKLDKAKKSNKKCEHCKHWGNDYSCGNVYVCTCGESQFFFQKRNYWNRCKCFEWEEGDKE